MRDPAKIVVDTPPPLPRWPGLSARLAAFTEITWLRTRARLGGLASWARRRPALAAASGAGVLLAIAAGSALALAAAPLPAARPSKLDEARAQAQALPEDAAAQVALAHSLWVAGKEEAALAAYDRALAIRPDVADDRLAADLLAAFGTKRQGEAEALIVKHMVAAAEKGLVGLTRSPRPAVRWGAVRTLDQLGAGSKTYWETAYVQDLESPRCEVRRLAVEKLGEIGTLGSVPALRSARTDDARTSRSVKRRCLGDRVAKAERKILARG